MDYSFQPISPLQAHLAAAWQYEYPYDFYNIPEGRRKFALHGYLNPNYHYNSILNTNGEWIGICTFGADARVAGGDYSQPATDIGLGLCPEKTGLGLGCEVVAAILNFAAQQDNHPVFRATIASFNRRSQRVFEKNGFHQTQEFSSPTGVRFQVWVKEPHQNNVLFENSNY